MSKKQHKKRHSQSSANAKRRAKQEEIADFKARDKNRMKPLARNILLGDLVLLAATQMMYSANLIGETFSGALTLVGVALLMLALYIQFVDKGPRNKSL